MTRSVALGRAGRHAEAAVGFAQAVRLEACYAPAWDNLAFALSQSGRRAEAIDAQRRLIALRPDDAEARLRLAIWLREQSRLSAARREFLEALRLNERLPVAWQGLSIVAAELGRIDEAVEALRRRAALLPSPLAGSDWLYARLHSAEGNEPANLLEAHREWGREVGADFKLQISDWRLAEESPPQPSSGIPGEGAMPGEGVRVGYVSADFREHAQVRFIEPLLRHHDRSAFQIFCYSDVRRADGATARLRALGDAWRDVASLDDRALARRIREDRIDVLVDLMGTWPARGWGPLPAVRRRCRWPGRAIPSPPDCRQWIT